MLTFSGAEIYPYLYERQIFSLQKRVLLLIAHAFGTHFIISLTNTVKKMYAELLIGFDCLLDFDFFYLFALFDDY